MATTVIQQQDNNCDVAAAMQCIKKAHNTATDIIQRADAGLNPAGENYANWIISTKQKLQEREISLLSIRLEIVKTAIHRTIEELNNDCINYKFGINIDMKRVSAMFKVINSHLITLCMSFLKQILSDWNGIDLSRSTKKFTTFRKYFVVSKNWFDQRKKSILTRNFWLNIFESIREFAANTADDICAGNKTEYMRYLLFTIIWAIFASKTQFSSTKPQPLIPGGTIKDTNDIKDFLQTVDDSLSMMKLLRKNGKECEQEASAQQTLQFILMQLKILSSEYKEIFHCNLEQKHLNLINTQLQFQYPAVHYPSVPSTPTVCSASSYSASSANGATQYNNNNNNINNNNIMNNNMINNNNNKYHTAEAWNATAANANNTVHYNTDCSVYNSNEDDARSYYQHPNNNSNNNAIMCAQTADIKPQRISNPFLPNINNMNQSFYSNQYSNNNHVNNSNNITNIHSTYSTAAANMKMKMRNNDNLAITEYPHLNNGNMNGSPAAAAAFGSGYGPIHHSSYNASDNRHSPTSSSFYYQSNINQNNCYQCNCNNCYI